MLFDMRTVAVRKTLKRESSKWKFCYLNHNVTAKTRAEAVSSSDRNIISDSTDNRAIAVKSLFNKTTKVEQWNHFQLSYIIENENKQDAKENSNNGPYVPVM